MLSLYAAPATEPVSLDEAKAQCRIDTADEDNLLEALIQTAREYVESFTHRALITQTWDLKLDSFPATIAVPYPTLQTTPTAPVITYVNTAGTTTTLSASLYTVDAPAGPKSSPGRIVPGYGLSWPDTRAVPNAVTVRFVAGYGADTAVPAGIKAAIRLLVAHWWTHREAVHLGASPTELPLAVQALLWPYKVV